MSACCFTRSAKDPASAMFPVLSAQFYYRDRRAAALFRFCRNFFHKRVCPQEFSEPAAEGPRAMSVDYPDSRLVGQRCVIEEFIHAARCFFHRAPDDVDFVGGLLIARRGSDSYAGTFRFCLFVFRLLSLDCLNVFQL